ncbi:hypothetical protein [Terriglobus roseus]|uniref:DUF2306 domain-containing protein n=1 Tax=Terriglobus roseus TaxID=392734 RepID=A0A1G7PMX1_9BACT|nr:hypothetical protein [Terriglobus roseus]SDF87621.1 hypothetical protein SAMN05444167_3567 [Terriglobus roseus]
MTGLQIFTLIHVLISLIGIATGFLVLFGFLRNSQNRSMNLLFLSTTALTSITGFFFPFHGITPAIVVGIISLVLFIPAIWGYQKGYRKTYIITASILQFFNVMVLVIQSFMKIPPLHQFAPTGKEPIVAIFQLLTLLFIGALATLGIRHREQ